MSATLTQKQTDLLNSGNTAQKAMTIKEVAELLGCGYSTVASYAQKAGWTKNGVQTLLNKKQVTVILEAMKTTVSQNDTLRVDLEGIETALTPILQLEMLQQEIAVANAKIQALKDAEIARLQAEKTTLAIQLDRSKQYYTVKRVAHLNGVNWRSIKWRELKTVSDYLQYDVRKVFDANYGNVNSYHIDVWQSVYPEFNYFGGAI